MHIVTEWSGREPLRMRGMCYFAAASNLADTRRVGDNLQFSSISTGVSLFRDVEVMADQGRIMSLISGTISRNQTILQCSIPTNCRPIY
ncbi:hypothetical protein J2W42_004434 [Rhizobium tibeticum]|nr:hypothetical protein [Rhizobium tibeticum]